MEDYKIKYEEALERAKYLKENTDSVGAKDTSAAFEYIFPELKESEDEKIRKELIEFIRTLPCTISVKNEFFVWLEKQGKQKPVDWNEKRKGLDELETYILSLDPNRSLDAVKVDAKNIRFLVNKDKTNDLRWAPSPKQMYILDWVANILLNHDGVVEKEVSKELRSLYKGLYNEYQIKNQ